jgi:hypothetical protein
MKTTMWTVIAVLAMSLMVVAAWAEGGQLPPPPTGAVGVGVATTATTPAATTGAAQAGPGKGRGYYKVTAETKALWDKQTQLQADMRTKQWELYTLLSAETPDRKAIKTKTSELHDLAAQGKLIAQQLAAFWTPLPAAHLAGGGKGGHHHKPTTTTTTPATTTPAATTPATPPAN